MSLDNIPVDTKIVLVSGCSYSKVFDYLDSFYKDYGILYINIGEAGRSNKWITQSIIYILEKLKNHPRKNLFVISLLTSVDRQDLVIDKNSNEFHKKLDFAEFTNPIFFTDLLSYRQYKWYNHVYDRNYSYDPYRKTGLLSITNLNWDEPDSPVSFEKFAGIYKKYFYTKVGVFEQTLQNILSLQSYCKLSNINYTFLTWQDIFYDTSFDPFYMFGQQLRNNNGKLEPIFCKYHKLQKRIDVYPELNYLYNQIDFSRWWFNKTERCETGGLADWCIEQNSNLFGTEYDTWHPNVNGYLQFADSILKPLIIQSTGWSTVQV